MTKKILSIIVTILACLIFATMILVSFIDYNLILQNYLISSNINIDAKNIGQIKVHKLPIPYLTVDSIKQEGKIDLQNIEVRFSLLSLIKFTPKIKSLRVVKANIYLANQDFTIMNHDLFINDLLSSHTFDVKVAIDSLNFYDANNAIMIKINNFSLIEVNDQSHQDIFTGKIANLGDFSGVFHKIDNDTTQFDLNIQNNYHNFQLSEIYKNSKLSSGKGNLKIIDFTSLLQSTFPNFHSMFQKLSADKIVDIKFDILPTQDLIQLRNLTVASDVITATGEIDISKNKDITSLLRINFSKIDLSPLMNSQSINQVQNKTPKHYRSGILSTIGNKRLTTDISIDKIILNETESLNNVKFTSNSDDVTFFINDFSGLIQSGGKFRVMGNITDNSYRSVFDGNIYLKHSDFNQILNAVGYKDASVKTITPFTVSSDLKFTLIDLYFHNLLLKSNDIKITGNVSTKFIGSTPHIDVNLDFSSMDIRKIEYPIIAPIIGFTENLLLNMKDKAYLNKFIPIRTLSYIGNFDLTFSDLIFNDRYIGNVNMLANLSSGNININNLAINNGSNFLFSSWNLEASSVKPKLNIKIEDGSFNVDCLTHTAWLDFRKTLTNDFSLDKVLLQLDCSLSKITQNDITLDKLNFSVNNTSTLLNLSNLDVDIFGGHLNGSGSILLEPHTINFVYALNSLDITKLLALLPKNLLNNSGSASINGMFSTNGDTLEKLLYNLYTKSTFIVKNLTIPNFGIDNFIKTIDPVGYNVQKITKDLNNALVNGSTEISTLKSSIELTKGVVVLNDIIFQTQYTSGSAVLGINIYDFSMNLSSILSFYLGVDSNPNNLVKIGIKSSGSIFAPQKTVNSDDLIEFLNKNSIKNAQ